MQKDPKKAAKTVQKPSGTPAKGSTPGVKKAPAGAKSGRQATKPAMINLRRTLRMGGRTTIDYTQKMMTRFERFVEQEDSGEKITRRFHFKISFTNFVAIAIVALLLALLIYSNTHIVTDEQKVTIVGVSTDFEGYSILHLSDLHGRRYGEKQASLLRSISNLDYDIVLITGDMVGKSGDPEPFYELLEGLGTSKPVYFIAGDSDPGPLISSARNIEGTLNQMVLEDWILGAIERGAIFLNKPVSLEVGTSTLWLSPASMLNINADNALEMAEYELDLQKEGVLGGIGVDYSDLPFTNYRYRQYKALKEAALYMEETDLHISLSHYPPTENTFLSAKSNVEATENAFLFAPDITFCGHYCGGVWRLPLVGAFYVPDSLAPRHGWLPAQESVSGLSQIASATVYTSAGLGVTDYGLFPDFRLMNSPQISLITLTTRLTDDLLAG